MTTRKWIYFGTTFDLGIPDDVTIGFRQIASSAILVFFSLTEPDGWKKDFKHSISCSTREFYCLCILNDHYTRLIPMKCILIWWKTYVKTNDAIMHVILIVGDNEQISLASLHESKPSRKRAPFCRFPDGDVVQFFPFSEKIFHHIMISAILSDYE